MKKAGFPTEFLSPQVLGALHSYANLPKSWCKNMTQVVDNIKVNVYYVKSVFLRVFPSISSIQIKGLVCLFLLGLIHQGLVVADLSPEVHRSPTAYPLRCSESCAVLPDVDSITKSLSTVRIDLHAIAQIESSGNPKAINRKDNGGIGSYGLHQVSPYALADFNKKHKTSFKPSDLLQAKTSTLVADWYINQEIPRLIAYYAKKNPKIRDAVDSRLTAYNMGIGAVVKGKRANRYIGRYLEITNAK